MGIENYFFLSRPNIEIEAVFPEIIYQRSIVGKQLPGWTPVSGA